MYRTWIPIHGRTLSKETRDIYLKQLQEAECAHIVIVAFEMDKDGAYEALADHIAFFQSHGVEAGIWIGTTIGHGEILSHDTKLEETPQYTPLVNTLGQTISGTRCPLDPAFRKDFAAYCARLGKTGAKTLLLDDDFRLSRRVGGAFCCTCDRHMAEMNRLVGEDLDREEFCRRAFSGEANKYRDAWIKAEGDSLRLLAREIRAAVDPDVRISLCTVHSHLDIDGVDGMELTHIFTGNHPPLLRLHGAPYWAKISSDKDLPSVFEVARMFASFCDGDVELISEGDVYPRPSYNIPASYLELFDAVMRADGRHSGILKYMVDYCASPLFETVYLAHHKADLKDLTAIKSRFGAGASLGVRVHIAPHRFRNADLSLDPPSDQSPYPNAGAMLQAAGVPTVYTGSGFCDAAFGEEGRYLDPAACKNGLILDAVSAILLTRRGFDVGLSEIGTFSAGTAAALRAHDPFEHATLMNGKGRFLSPTLKNGAEILEYALVNGEELPLLYRYENAQGQRFLVSLFSGMSVHRSSGIFHSYLHVQSLRSGIEWLTKKPLPVRLPISKGLYSLASERDGHRVILLCNTGEDRILSPTVTLDRPYTGISAIGCTAQLSGNTVTLSSPLPALSFAALEVY